MQSGIKSHVLRGREQQGKAAPCNEEGSSQTTHSALREPVKGHIGEEKRGEKTC